MKSFLWKVIAAVASAATAVSVWTLNVHSRAKSLEFLTLLTNDLMHILAMKDLSIIPHKYLVHPVAGLAMAMAIVPLCLNPFLDVLRGGRKEGGRERWGWLGRWKKFDVMVDVVVWGDACLLACLLVLQFAGLTFLDGTT